MTTYTYKNKGDQARALLIEGKSAKEISEVTGLATGTIGIYFYKMKQKGEIDGTTSKPIANEQSALFLERIRIAETSSNSTPNEPTSNELTSNEKTMQEEPTPKVPAAPIGKPNTLKEEASKEEAPKPKNTSIEATIIETVNDLAMKKVPLLSLKELIKDLSKRLGMKEANVEFTVRLIRSNGVIEQIAKTQNIPLSYVNRMRDALEMNQLLGEAKPTGNVQEPDYLLVTKPVEGISGKNQAAIESHLLGNMNARAVSYAVKVDIKYVYAVQHALEKAGKLKLTLDQAYGKDTITKIKCHLLDGKSITQTHEAFPDIPRDAIMTLANHVPSRAERSKHYRMKARQMFLDGKNSFDVARDLPLNFEEANTVFIEMKKEKLIDGTAVEPMLLDPLGKTIDKPVTPKPNAITPVRPQDHLKSMQQLSNLPMHDKKKIAALAEDARTGKFNLFEHMTPQPAEQSETTPEVEQTTTPVPATPTDASVPIHEKAPEVEQKDETAETKTEPFPLVEETFRDASDVEYKQLAMADEEDSLVKQLAASISSLPQHLVPDGLHIKTNLNLTRNRIDLSTVRTQFEHMLKMAEMSGNIEFNVYLNIASVE